MRIVDPTVSRLHAMLTLRGGDAMLVDANSRNGVFVNGIQVRYAKLEDGDLVTFGTVRYRYRVGSTTTAAAYSG
jgi:pSer/pThr/pTyr-binding forkhead associated (FHA) protein